MPIRTTQQAGGVEVVIEGDGPDTIVMIHGWPDTYRLWDGQVAALAGRFRCVRFTLPGFDIGGPRRAYSMAEIVATIDAVVALASPGRPVILMLHDWGCFFGYQYAMHSPQRVSRLIGVDIGDTTSRAYRTSLTLKARLMVFAYQSWLAAAWRIGGGLGERMTRQIVRIGQCPSDPRFIGSAMNYPYDILWTGSHGSYRGLKRFVPACPMLFIFGTRKPFLFHAPAWAEWLAAQPGSRVVPIRARHWVMLDEPRQFNEAVLAWLAQG